MDISTDLSSISYFDKSILTIGSFDGMHSGHMQIIKELQIRAKHKKVPSVVLTFDPHPKTILNKKEKDKWKLLTSIDKKLELIESHRIDYTCILPFNIDFAKVTASNFLNNYIIKYFNPVEIIVGYNHHFGYKRKGDSIYLNKVKGKYKYKLTVKDPIKIDDIPVSSTKIRTYLKESNIKTANKLLGREYEISGKIIKGQGRGAKIDFPTANIKPNVLNQLIPARGVYCVDAIVDNRLYIGMCNIGVRPTFYENGNDEIEVHLITDNKLSLYGKEMLIKFKTFIRNEKKYENAIDLTKQLKRDRYTCLQ